MARSTSLQLLQRFFGLLQLLFGLLQLFLGFLQFGLATFDIVKQIVDFGETAMATSKAGSSLDSSYGLVTYAMAPAPWPF